MKKIITLGIVAFLFFLIAKAPAYLLLPYINKQTYFKAQTAQGSIWSAKFSATGVVKQIDWDVNAWQLLLARLAIKTNLNNDESNNLNAYLTINLLSKSITVDNLTGQLTTDYLEKFLPQFNKINIKSKLNINSLNIFWDNLFDNKIPQQLSGEVNIDELNIFKQKLGNYLIKLSSEEEQLLGNLSSKKQALIDAKLLLSLDTKKQFKAKGEVIAKDENIKKILADMNIPQKVNYTTDISKL